MSAGGDVNGYATLAMHNNGNWFIKLATEYYRHKFKDSRGVVFYKIFLMKVILSLLAPASSLN